MKELPGFAKTSLDISDRKRSLVMILEYYPESWLMLQDPICVRWEKKRMIIWYKRNLGTQPVNTVVSVPAANSQVLSDDVLYMLSESALFNINNLPPRASQACPVALRILSVKCERLFMV